MKPHAFLDIDGIIADLARSVTEAFGPASLDMLGSPTDAPWRGLGREFWKNVHWTEDGREIMAVVEDHFGLENVALCTRAVRCPEYMAGRFEWIESQLDPHYANSFLLTRDKWRSANAHTTLIDDLNGNVDRFIAAGGQGIVLPRPWNRNADKGCPIQYLKDTLCAKR